MNKNVKKEKEMQDYKSTSTKNVLKAWKKKRHKKWNEKEMNKSSLQKILPQKSIARLEKRRQ